MSVSESEVKNFLRSLIVSSSSKLTVYTLNKYFNELVGCNIPFKKLGYSSLLHFLNSIPDVLHIKGTSTHSEVALVVSEKIEHINDLETNQEKPSEGSTARIRRKKVTDDSITNTKTRSNTPDNIPLNYKKCTVEERSNQIRGVNTNLKKSKQMEESEQEENCLETCVYRKTPQIDSLSTKPLESINWDEYSKYVPQEALKLGKKVKGCAKDFIVGHRIPIEISAICDPGKFWIIKDDRVLGNMMNVMQTFYTHQRRKYRIPEFLLYEGLYCVVKRLGEYQRGLIVNISKKVTKSVKVVFIDHGSEACILKNNIWFLKKEFSRLPAQALRVKLSNIEPVKKVWNEQSTRRFVDFVSGKQILAYVSINKEKKIVAQISEDTYPSKILNDVLVEEGFATYNNKKTVSDAGTARRRSDIPILADPTGMKKTAHSVPAN